MVMCAPLAVVGNMSPLIIRERLLMPVLTNRTKHYMGFKANSAKEIADLEHKYAEVISDIARAVNTMVELNNQLVKLKPKEDDPSWEKASWGAAIEQAFSGPNTSPKYTLSGGFWRQDLINVAEGKTPRIVELLDAWAYNKDRE